MADADPVDITVKIKDKFSSQINKLKGQLKSIQNRVDVSLQIDDNGDIEWAQVQLDQIDDLIEVLMMVKDGDLDKALAKIQALDGKVTKSTHIVQTTGFEGLMDGDDGNLWNGTDPPWAEAIQKAKDNKTKLTDSTNYRDLTDGLDNTRALGGNRMAQHSFSEGYAGNFNVPDYDGMIQRSKSRKTRIAERIGSVGEATAGSMSKLDGVMKRMKPSMRKYTKLLAAFIPILATVATQALGVAAAFGAVGVAGGAMLGLGLLGYGDDMASSMEGAKERIQEFKKELYDVFKPAMDLFQPITEGFLNVAPGEMTGIMQEMKGLTSFRGTLFSGLEGGTDWIADLIGLITDLQPEISQLTERFGDIIGTAILDFFRWLIEEASASQDMLISLGGALADVAMLLYNVSKAISDVALMFRPLLDLVKWISGLLNNEFVMGLAKAVAGAYALARAMKAVGFAMASTGIGALLAGGGILGYELLSSTMGPDMSGPGQRGGGGDKYVMNVEGNATEDVMSDWEGMVNGEINAAETDDDWEDF